MPLFNITYLSSAIPEFTREELIAALEHWKARNEAENVSGILIYHEGNILQVLEGEQATVKATFQRISRDLRHVGILPLIQEPIAERQFDEWTMAFRDLTLDSDEIDGFNDLLNATHPEAELHLAPSKVKTFLLGFVRRASRLNPAVAVG
jgi:hypothetical protein